LIGDSTRLIVNSSRLGFKIALLGLKVVSIFCTSIERQIMSFDTLSFVNTSHKTSLRFRIGIIRSNTSIAGN
jgi:hypothetical protein